MDRNGSARGGTDGRARDRVRAQEAGIRRATLEERARLAREIHDRLVQSLWLARLRQGELLALDLSAEEREAAETVARGLDEGLAESREAIVVLAAGTDGPAGIDELARRSAERLAGDLDLDVRFTASGSFPPLEPRGSAEMLTIMREALVNTGRHADASVVEVRLASAGDGLTLEVADNGRGFDTGATVHGLGMRSMTERAEGMGGRLTVRSAPMDGTTVTLRLPYASVGAPE